MRLGTLTKIEISIVIAINHIIISQLMRNLTILQPKDLCVLYFIPIENLAIMLRTATFSRNLFQA